MSIAKRLYFSETLDPQPSVDLLDFEAEVTDIREVSRTNGQPLWQLALDRTAFYPAGGGQPSDLGHLQAVARSGATLEVPVLRAEEDDAGEVWHFVAKPLAAGTRISGHVDPARRNEHRQQHSGQHLLSALFLREFHAPTLSFHLGEDVSTIDIELDALDPDALAHIETQVNLAIAADLPVRARWVDRAEAETMLADGRLRKLPDRSGPIRLVEIESVEDNACGGTHVRSTGQIGSIMLRRTERIRKTLRVEFVCGLRSVRAARADFETLAESARLLSISPNDIFARITRLTEEAKAAEKQRRLLLTEMAALEARLLVAGAGGAEATGLMEVLLVERDAAYAKLLAARLVAEAPAAMALVAAVEGVRATLILTRGPASNLDCSLIMRSAMASLGVRGGGSPDLAQGAIPLEALEDATAILRSVAGF